MRHFSAIAAVFAAVFSLIATSVAASDWTPPDPIKLMIGFRVGGGADTQARLIAEEIENRLGWKFIPNR